MPFPQELPPPSPYAAPGWSSSGIAPLADASAADWAALRTLSLLVFLFAALCALAWACLAFILGVGIHLETTGQASATNPVPAFVVLGLALAMLTPLLVLLAWTGLSLRRARRRDLCLVTAGLACFLFPLGTALGIAVLVVLQRPGARALFAAGNAS